MADVFNQSEFVYTVRRYYRIVEDAKRVYIAELRKELDFAKRQGDVPYYSELEGELAHTQLETGHQVSEYMPKRKALFNAKLQLKRTVDRTRESFKKYIEELAGELLKAGRIDEAKSMQNIAALDEPPRHLGQPGKRIPEPTTARGRQLLRNILSADEKPLPAVEIPQDNPFALVVKRDALWKALKDDFGSMPPDLTLEEIERFRIARKKGMNIPDAQLRTELSSHPDSWIPFGQFSPDGKKFIAVSNGEKGCNVFDIATGTVAAKLSYPHSRWLCGIDIHPKGKVVVTGTSNGKILLWNIDNGAILREINAHENVVDGIRFSPDGLFIASGSHDKTAAIWDTRTGEERMRFKGHTGIVWTVDISPDGKLLATSSEDRSVRLWDIETGKELHCMQGHNDRVVGLAFNHQGTMIVSGSRDQTVAFWDVKTGKRIERLVGCEGEIQSICFSPDDKRVVFSCASPYHSSVWDTQTKMPLYRLPTFSGVVRTARYSSEGKTIATC